MPDDKSILSVFRHRKQSLRKYLAGMVSSSRTVLKKNEYSR